MWCFLPFFLYIIGKWQEYEHSVFVKALSKYGKNWKKIHEIVLYLCYSYYGLVAITNINSDKITRSKVSIKACDKRQWRTTYLYES